MRMRERKFALIIFKIVEKVKKKTEIHVRRRERGVCEWVGKMERNFFFLFFFYILSKKEEIKLNLR